MVYKTSCTCGCFAKDVLIQMADHSSKPIEQIRIGDAIITKDNGVQTVRDISTSFENTIVTIIVSNGRKIRVTKDHPILSDNNDMKRADELKVGTIIVSEDGETPVLAVWEEVYNDTVYNLNLEKGSILLANGIYAGDFQMQIEYSKPSNNWNYEDYKELLSMFEEKIK